MQYQYLKFYQEVADFTESIGLCNKGGLRGLNEAEISDYEKENKITFGEEYKIALKVLGKRKGHCLIYLPPNFNTLNQVKNQEIEYRIDMELEPSDLSWKEEIKKKMQTNDDFLNNYGIEEPIILSYYEFGGDISFTLSKSEKFIIHRYNIETEKFAFPTPFIVQFRRFLFSSLINFIFPISDTSYYRNYRKYLTREVMSNLHKIQWLVLYKKLKENKSRFIHSSKFHLISYKNEMENESFFGIDEFEVQHLRYRKLIGEIEDNSDFLEKGKEVVKFREYLN